MACRGAARRSRGPRRPSRGGRRGARRTRRAGRATPARRWRRRAPRPCAARSATASSSGPVPATTARRPAKVAPAFSRACAPPAPTTPGRVHPGNGRNSSRAPVASTRRSYSTTTAAPARSTSSRRGDGVSTTDALVTTGTPERASRSSHRAGVGAGPPRARQIEPPGRGASSRTRTRAPASAACTAAAIPAGPAPTTTTAALSRSATRGDFHAVAHRLEARASLRGTVDGDAALEADAHAAQRPPRLAGHRGADRAHARVPQRGKHGRARARPRAAGRRHG